jgi:hypothetical protein
MNFQGSGFRVHRFRVWGSERLVAALLIVTEADGLVEWEFFLESIGIYDFRYRILDVGFKVNRREDLTAK